MSKKHRESLVGNARIWKKERRTAGLSLVAMVAVFVWLLPGCVWRQPSASLGSGRVGTRLLFPIGGGQTITVKYIPAGTFTMGSPAGETNSSTDETQHQVTLTKAFWLGRTAVTQSQWRAVMGTNPSGFIGDDLPVETVSWNDAMEYCRKLNGMGLLPSGWKFALPTEAQWEYACRAGTNGPYAGDLDDMAWYSGNSGGKTHPVATKKPNAWGLYDMHGNVEQWCADWYGTYPSDAVTDPSGPSTGLLRVSRGGGWHPGGTYCRSAFRSWGAPDYQNGSIGFRVAAVPSP